MQSKNETKPVRITRTSVYLTGGPLEIWRISTPTKPFPWEADTDDTQQYRVTEIALHLLTGELVVNDHVLLYPQPNEATIFSIAAPVLYMRGGISRVYISGHSDRAYRIEYNEEFKLLTFVPLFTECAETILVQLPPYEVVEPEQDPDKSGPQKNTEQAASDVGATINDINVTLCLAKTEGSIQFWERQYDDPFSTERGGGTWYGDMIAFDTRTLSVINTKDCIDAGPIESLWFFAPLVHHLKLERIEIKNVSYRCTTHDTAVVFRLDTDEDEGGKLRFVPKYTVLHAP